MGFMKNVKTLGAAAAKQAVASRQTASTGTPKQSSATQIAKAVTSASSAMRGRTSSRRGGGFISRSTRTAGRALSNAKKSNIF